MAGPDEKFIFDKAEEIPPIVFFHFHSHKAGSLSSSVRHGSGDIQIEIRKEEVPYTKHLH
jgi:hypothetical protein